MESIAVVGFGDMGQEMVPHLISAGYPVRVFDHDPGKLERAAELGAVTTSSAADAASGADVVLGLVMSDDIPGAYFGVTGILAGAGSGALVLVASTTTPELVRQIQSAAAEGTRVLDTPMVGGVRFAREAALTFLVGSDNESDNPRVDGVLSVLGKVRFVGGLGSGVAYKLITNVAIMAAEAGIREALDLADILGKDYETALHLMAVGPMAPVVSRALDTTNPRPLRRSAEDDETLLSVVASPEADLPISYAGAKRLWEAVTATPGYEPDFVDLTRKTTSRPRYRQQ
ncbi:NAD(P)-dependent oxidoreductase [Nocardia testacea]|uniref:NAD(P)-dependent oxidoreductase n=1 Tax=Nocardia testacea TaxID=248551 RepID=UPI0033D14052